MLMLGAAAVADFDPGKIMTVQLADGLDYATSVAHAIRRPDDVAMFGYEEPPVVTDADRAKLDRAETITDDILEPAYAALSDAQADALVAGTNSMHAALTSG